MKKILGIFFFAFLLIGTGMHSQARETAPVYKNSYFSASVSNVYVATSANNKVARQNVLAPTARTALVRGLLWHHREPLDLNQLRQKYKGDPKMLKIAEEISKTQQAIERSRQGWRKRIEKRNKI